MTRQEEKQTLLLEEEVEHLEQELAEKYYQLGKGIYELADHKIGEINLLVDRLVEHKITLAQARGLTQCPMCLSQNPIENAYCGKCGNLLEPSERRSQT